MDDQIQPTEEGRENTRQIVVQVLRHLREGETGPSARYEFPDNATIFELMMTASEAEKKYRFYFFDNVLVASVYTPEADDFLMEAGKRAGYKLTIEDA